MGSRAAPYEEQFRDAFSNGHPCSPQVPPHAKWAVGVREQDATRGFAEQRLTAELATRPLARRAPGWPVPLTSTDPGSNTAVDQVGSWDAWSWPRIRRPA